MAITYLYSCGRFRIPKHIYTRGRGNTPIPVTRNSVEEKFSIMPREAGKERLGKEGARRGGKVMRGKMKRRDMGRKRFWM